MAIKQLEDNDKGFYIKTVLLGLLLVGALIIGARKYNFQKDNRHVLGKEFKLINSKNFRNKEIAKVKKESSQFIKKARKNGEKIVGQILGKTTKLVDQTASKSAETVNDFIFQNTVKKFVDQIDKLPEGQKNKVIENLCNQD